MTPEQQIPTTKYDLLEKKNSLNRAARRAFESHTAKKDKQYHLSREMSQKLIMEKYGKN